MKFKAKRLLSILITLCMIMMLTPALSIAVFASEADNITIFGVTELTCEVTEEAPAVEEEPQANDEPPAEEPPAEEPPAEAPKEEEPAKEEGSEEEIEITEEELPPTEEAIIGVTISGYVISNNPNIPTVIELSQDGEVKYSVTIEAEAGSGQVTQSYSVTDVEAGVYTLKVTKKAHLSYAMMTLEVSEDDVSMFEVTLKPGDLNGDGVIDMADLAILINGYGRAGENMIDLNGDGIIDEADLELLIKWYGEKDTIVEGGLK